jgi:hypothetical protein
MDAQARQPRESRGKPSKRLPYHELVDLLEKLLGACLEEIRRLGCVMLMVSKVLKATYAGAPVRSLTPLLLFACAISSVTPVAYALPSYARQTGQRCAACHVGGNYPQLTPWGRFFKLAGYTPGKEFIDREGFEYLPLGILGRAGITWAGQPKNSQGHTVIADNGAPEFYDVAFELGTKATDWAGVFAEYAVFNTFPGWKGLSARTDIRATHFFHPKNHELLVGFDMNNEPSVQDVWNTVPAWQYPFFSTPQAPAAPASTRIADLASDVGSVGVYALLDRHIYAEVSTYHVAKDFFRFMSGGISYQKGAPYVDGWNPYWRAYWTKDWGPNVWMVGTIGMRSGIFPNSAAPSGPTNNFNDYGVDSQYQYLGDTRKLTLRASYIYERQLWHGSFPLGKVSVPKSNLKTLFFNGSFALREAWTFTGGYFFSNGSNNAALFGVTGPNGNLLSAKPNTTGYQVEVDRTLTQNILVLVKYAGFTKFNGLTDNIDGRSRKPSDNNTLFIVVDFAF